MRYKFYVADKKIICVSSYAGKAVRGVAKCGPDDKFEIENGKKLAALRCDCKIAEKRMRRAMQKHSEALKLLEDARVYCDNMQRYYEESVAEFSKLTEDLAALEKSM